MAMYDHAYPLQTTMEYMHILKRHLLKGLTPASLLA